MNSYRACEVIRSLGPWPSAAASEPSVGRAQPRISTLRLLSQPQILTRTIANPKLPSLRGADQQMGKAYNQDQRDRVKVLLEAGRDEETIEKETGVSDRTIRRWKMELERTGRIGKPPESRTGRHRVLNPDTETVSLRFGNNRAHVVLCCHSELTCEFVCRL